MDSIEQMYQMIVETISEYSKSVDVYVYSDDGLGDSPVVGREKKFTQIVMLEITEPLESPKEFQVLLLEATNGTGWTVVDEDSVFEGDIGQVSISREAKSDEIQLGLGENFNEETVV